MSKNSLPIFEDTGAVNVIESSFTPGIIPKSQEDFPTFALKAMFCLSRTVKVIFDFELIKDKCSCLSYLSPTDDFTNGISGSDLSEELSASFSQAGQSLK